MIITKEILYILLAVLIVCLVGFRKYIWFISIGYGLSISAIALMLLLLFGGSLETATILYCIIMACYGFRLGGFLIFREVKTGYNARMKGEISDGSGMSFGLKLMLWLSCALLYLMMMSPLIYRCTNASGSNAAEICGMVVSICGILMEAVSDAQKNAAKKVNPGRFCSDGLFRFVRCPNYLGELIIWTGMFISGFGAVSSTGQWIVAIIGYLGIVYIMFSGARRLEIRQDKNYGGDSAYRKYKASTPILIPFVPLYSVKKHSWLVG